VSQQQGPRPAELLVTVVRGAGERSPQKLKVFRCIYGISSKFLYFLEAIVKIQHLDVMFTVTAREVLLRKNISQL